MFHHTAWAVGKYSSGSPPAGTVGTKSTGGFYQADVSPCIYHHAQEAARRLDNDMQRPGERSAQHLVFFDAGWRRPRPITFLLRKMERKEEGVHFWAEKKEREEISIVCCPSFEDRSAVVAFSLLAAKSDKDVVVVVA